MQFNFVAHAPKNIYIYLYIQYFWGNPGAQGHIWIWTETEKFVNVCRREPSNSDLNKSNFVKKKRK